MEKIRNSLKQRRQQAGLTQQELAVQALVSRQALNGIEAGPVVPGTDLSLRLSGILGCRVEELFWFDQSGRELLAELQPEAPGDSGDRVVLGVVAGRWVAHRLRQGDPLAFLTSADGLLARRRGDSKPGAGPGAKGGASPAGPGAQVLVQPLRALDGLRGNLLLSGCDPALALLAARVGERHPGQRVVWLQAQSDTALRSLSAGLVHVAGAHLFDEATGEYNVPFVQRSFAGRAMLVITFAQIEEGFCVAPGNPRGIRKPQDLARPGVRLINRALGAGSRRLLDRLLAKAKVPPSSVQGYQRTARGHLDAAQQVAAGAADVGVVARSAALACGLDFVPFASERFDLVVPKEWAADPRVLRLLETLETRAFKRELASLGGYDVARAGQVVAELRPAVEASLEAQVQQPPPAAARAASGPAPAPGSGRAPRGSDRPRRGTARRPR